MGQQAVLVVASLFFQSLFLWLVFTFLGESVPFFKCVLWHLLTMIIWILIAFFMVGGAALALMVASQNSTAASVAGQFVFWFSLIFGFVFHFWLMAKFFECELSKACLTTIIYGFMYTTLSVVPAFYFLKKLDVF